MKPDVAIVINLARRVDRRKAFLARWKERGLADVELIVFQATDHPQLPVPDDRWSGFPEGAWACWDSHYRALRRASGVALVLEDDAVFAPDFEAKLSALVLPPGWDVVHLGGQHLLEPEPVVPGIVKPRWTLRSHAYLAAHPQTLASALRTKPTHVDVALGQLPLARFAVDPWLVGQDDSPGDVTRKAPSHVDFWQEARSGA